VCGKARDLFATQLVGIIETVVPVKFWHSFPHLAGAGSSRRATGPGCFGNNPRLTATNNHQCRPAATIQKWNCTLTRGQGE